MATVFPNFAIPRATIKQTPVEITTSTYTSASLFQVSGGPIAVWGMDAETVVAFPGANVQWNCVITPTDNPALATDFFTTTQTFFGAYAVGTYWGVDAEVAGAMIAPADLAIRFVPNFIRIIPPCTLTHVNISSAGTPAAQIRYRIIWSPLSANSTVRAL